MEGMQIFFIVSSLNLPLTRYYAIKKIKIDGSNQALTTKMLREVTTLSRLHHQYVVRYYQAWIERADFTSMAVEGDDDEDEGDEGDDEDDEGILLAYFYSLFSSFILFSLFFV
jgi:translation initiation factor 2-alpha kinase 4